ncbi:MAG: hypothetical protein RLZZ618_1215 [Pseudomonadota bacterium]
MSASIFKSVAFAIVTLGAIAVLVVAGMAEQPHPGRMPEQAIQSIR